MKARHAPIIFPWITLYIAVLIPLLTYSYNSFLTQAQRSPLALWLTSPFNITYELTNPHGFFYNYLLVVALYLAVELYSRNIADIEGRNSLIRSAFLLSVFSSYLISAVVWYSVGFPSSGSSIIAFNLLLFAAFETYDSELIRRMSESRKDIKRMLEIASIMIIVLMVIFSALLFMYLNGNGFWYVHVAGGAVFTPLYFLYLNRWVRPRFDSFVEEAEAWTMRHLEKKAAA